MKRCNAFTLVEILVVIGIIAVLISLRLPSLNKARRSANQVACSSNLRQVGLAHQLYMQDNKGHQVEGSLAVPPPTTFLFWTDLLRPYLGLKKYYDGSVQPIPPEAKVLICPEDVTYGGMYDLGALPYGRPIASPDFALRSYSLNMEMYGKKMAQIRRTSETLFLGEAQWWQISSVWIRSDSYFVNIMPLKWHPGKRVNLLCYDGHVEAVAVSTLYPGGSNARFWKSE